MVQTSDPSKGVTREVLKQLCTVPIVDIDSKLDWLYEVWPRLAVRVVRDSGWPPYSTARRSGGGAITTYGQDMMAPSRQAGAPEGTERQAAAVGSGSSAIIS